MCIRDRFQKRPVEHHAFEAYLEKVGRIYQRFQKGKLPILMIDGVSSLARDSSHILDDLAYMAKGLAEARSMIIVFGLLDAFGPCVLNSRGYNINRQQIYLDYISQEDAELYAEKCISKSHPLRQKVLEAISTDNQKIFGGNFAYIDMLIEHLGEATTEKQIAEARKKVEQKVLFDINDEMKKIQVPRRDSYRFNVQNVSFKGF
eukprot:TRINITY_DN8421_c0_g2_i1.p1 TRINITY_DN8421_c0_g2~~TRINITY_DN8421_c0_g2_i1.p1  ORF type:complete len:204 (+),score=33.61 TRINITY_DN8421_c0_g2_i1:197-808(+)